MIKEIKEQYVATHIVDDETGEVLISMPCTKKKKKVTSFDCYIGKDTRFIQDCMTADQLLETLSVMDAYVNDPVKVNDTFIMENVVAGNLTVQQQILLRMLSKAVCGWSYYYGDIKSVCQMGVDQKSIWRALRSLEEKKMLKLVRKDMPHKGCICLKLNPLLVWKGDSQYRENSKLSWYSVKKPDQ
jgi:hypothetical protein